MRGRLHAQWSALVWEAIFLFFFTQIHTIGPAIVVLVLFSGRPDGGGLHVRHRALRLPGGDGSRVGHRGRRR